MDVGVTEYVTMTTAVLCKHHITFPFQAHGAMGWRVGYIAYPDHDGSNFLGLQLVKARKAHPPTACFCGYVLASVWTLLAAVLIKEDSHL